MGFVKDSWCPLIIVIMSSSSSVPIAYMLNKSDAMKDERLVCCAGIVCLFFALVLPVLCIRQFFHNVDALIYGCCLFSWSCVIDLCLALELDNRISGIMSFYFKEGEPYLRTAYGMLINYWDGTVHLLLYLAMLLIFCLRRSYREVGLFWIGSIMNSLLVLLPGSMIGTFEVKWSFMLNLPYLLVPLGAAFKFFRERPMYIKSYYIVKPLLQRWVDLLFVIYFIFAGAVAVFRGLAVLGCKSPLFLDYISKVEPNLADPNCYPKMQMLCYMFYFVFFYLCSIYGLLYLKQGWMADWSLIHAGASAQGQFVYIFASLNSRTPKSLQNPTTGLAGLAFWTVNLALLIVPLLFAWRCLKDPENCGRTGTIEKAELRQEPEISKKAE